jgi:hypothetical protein
MEIGGADGQDQAGEKEAQDFDEQFHAASKRMG